MPHPTESLPTVVPLSDASIDAELFENSPDCIKVLTLDGTIKRLSPGGQVALELDRLDQLDGVNWPSLWPGSEQSRIEHAVSEARAGKRMQFLAFCPTAKNSPRWWDVVVTPMPGAALSVQGLLVVSRDVTELVEARDALVQANERKSEFLTVLSHELRNPLSALQMAAKLLQNFSNQPEQTAKISEMIARQVGHISRLAEDLLDISRISRGRISLRAEAFDLRDALRDAKEQLESMVAYNKQQLQESLPAHPVMVMGDRMRLTQVFGNLIGNAARYSPPDTRIDLSLVARDRCALVTVADQGQGISSELIPKLFDIYSQGQHVPERKASGLGVGLAIVKALVELHEGTVQVESEGIGFGSTFTVSLPLK